MKKMGVLLAILGSMLLFAGLVLTSMIEQSHCSGTEASLLLSLARRMGAVRELPLKLQLQLWGMENVLLVYAAGALSILSGAVMIHKANEEERLTEEANGHQNTWRCHKCNHFNKMKHVTCTSCGHVDVLK